MIYTACLMIYAGLLYSQSTNFRIILATLLIGLSVFINRLLPLPSGPNLPPKRLCASHRLHRLQKHVRHGVHAASVSPQDRGEAHVGDAEDRAQVSG